MEADEGWDLVAAWLQAEIDDRGVSIAAVERETQVSYKTIRRLLRGEPVSRRDRLGTLARGLGYRADAFDLIRAGEPPVRLVMEQLAQSSPAGDPTSLAARLARLSLRRPAVRQGLHRRRGAQDGGPVSDVEQWEYRVVVVKNPDLGGMGDQMNRLGADGWELVSTLTTVKTWVNMTGNDLAFVFKRRGVGAFTAEQEQGPDYVAW